MSYFFHKYALLHGLSIKLVTIPNAAQKISLTICLHWCWRCNPWYHSHVKLVTAQRLAT